MEHLIDGLSLSDLQQLNESLLAGGYSIGEMNRIRKTLSAIKGGKFCHYLPNVPVTQLVISDVPGDALSDIGSGPFVSPRNIDEVHPGDILSQSKIHTSDVILACVNAFGVSPPIATHWVWNNVQTRIVGSSRLAQDAVLNAAQSLGLPHLALTIAKLIAGNEHLRVLCCGTDGTDGPTNDAGALVTGNTIKHGTDLGLSVDDYLQAADAGSYLDAVHALVTTGPTGTNVMDLVIATNIPKNS